VCGAAGSCNGGKEDGCNQQVCCQDYQGGFTADQAQSSCAAIGGAYSSAPCRSQNLVGSCILYEGSVAQQTLRYYASYVTRDHSPGLDSATDNCDGISGTWAMPQTAVPNGPCGLTSSSGGGSGGGTGGSGSSGGGGPGGPTTFSCNGHGGSNLHCYEYKNVPPAELAVLKSSCKGVEGTGCPVANLAGCCITSHTPGAMTMEVCFYAPLTTQKVRSGCSHQGTYSATP
jgi:hypothetical protein